jgi:signal transduction histidine kinase
MQLVSTKHTQWPVIAVESFGYAMVSSLRVCWPMTALEDLSLQRRFRYLEWAAIFLTSCAQLAWTCASVKFDSLVAASFLLLALSGVAAFFTPATTRGRCLQLICQAALFAMASALGAHRYYYVNLYVLAAKAALLLPRKQIILIACVLVISHIIAGQLAMYEMQQHIHKHIRPAADYYDAIILEVQTAIYFLVGLITVTFLGRTLIAERQGRIAEQRLAKKVEHLTVRLERARIARDIHDGLGHSMTSLRIQLELVLKMFDEDQAKRALELLKQCQQTAGSSLQEVRRALNTEQDEDFDLQQALTALLEQINRHGDLIFKTDLAEISLPPTVQHQIFSIVQECLTNVRKHSSADHVEISLRQKDGHATICIQDNGKGFDVHSVNSGHGLKGLRERAETIGATINIESAAGEGTTVVVSFPIEGSTKVSLSRTGTGSIAPARATAGPADKTQWSARD